MFLTNLSSTLSSRRKEVQGRRTGEGLTGKARMRIFEAPGLSLLDFSAPFIAREFAFVRRMEKSGE